LLIFSSIISRGAGIPLQQGEHTMNKFIPIDTTTTDTGSDNSGEFWGHHTELFAG